MNLFIHSLKHLFDFKGRASRKEYWLFILMGWFISFFLMLVLKNIFGINLGSFEYSEFSNSIPNIIGNTLFFLYTLVIITANICISIRRFHDIGKSGFYKFFELIPFFGFIYSLSLRLLPGDIGRNKYGEDPYKDTYPAETDENFESFIQNKRNKQKKRAIVYVPSAILIFIASIFLMIVFIDKIGLNIVIKEETATIPQLIGGNLLYDMKITRAKNKREHNFNFSYISSEKDTTFLGSVSCKAMPYSLFIQASLFEEWIIVPVNADYSTQLLMYNFEKNETILHKIDYKFVSQNIYGKEKYFLKVKNLYFIDKVVDNVVTIVMVDPNDAKLAEELDPKSLHYLNYKIDEVSGKLSYHNM